MHPNPVERPWRRAACAFVATFAAVSCSALAAPAAGVFSGNAPLGPQKVDEHSRWLGAPVTVATAFSPRATWGDIEGLGWNLQPWGQWIRDQAGRTISFHVPPLPSSGGSLASCAAGQHDAHFAKLANNLAAYGLQSVYLRVGAEMDGGWYPWNAPRGSGKEASFAGCFRRIVTAMRQAQPSNQWKFVLNVAQEFGGSRAYLDAVWPGDAYVDVVGLDFRDHSWSANTYPYPAGCSSSCRLARQQTVWNLNAPVLHAVRDFARAHGKPMALPEWGTGTRTDGHGGGDNPYFIQKMHEFLSDPANNVEYQAYWDDPASDWNAMLSGATSFPQASAMFRTLFGSMTPANTAPSVSITSPVVGQTVSGTLSYAADASDNAGVSRVDFALGSTALASDTAAPYGGTVDTTRLANGTHVLRATAYDAQGLSTTTQVSINVQNAATPAAPSPAGPTGVTLTAPSIMSGAYRDSAACQVTGTGITRVLFFIDTTQVTADGLAPWQCNFDTRSFTNGTHTLRAVAYNAAGGSITVSQVVTVENGTTPTPTSPTNTAPSISIASPAAGQAVSGTVSYAANATDDAGVSRVDFTLDGTALASDTVAPFGGSIDTTRFANGTHVLRATAFDAQGLSAAAQVTINVQNAVAGGTITPHIHAARISGVAPLCVHFDASATTSTLTSRRFHELDYSWDFGDSDGGAWTYGTRTGAGSKNVAYGPIAAHCFETAGSKTVTLTARHGSTTASTTQSISVTHPDTVYSGANTICVSATGTFTGCPGGARQVTSSDFDDALTKNAGANKRVLFNRGETYTASTGVSLTNTGPMTIGAYGSGAKPIVNMHNGTLFTLSSRGTPAAGDWRFMDLEINGANGASANVFGAGGNFNKLTILRVDAHDFDHGLVMSTGVLSVGQMWDQIAVVDSTFVDSSEYALFLSGTNLALIGNRLDDALDGQHVVRLNYGQKVVIASNTMRGGAATKHVLKLGAPNFGSSTIPPARTHTEKVVLADNTFESGNDVWTVAIGPQNNSSDERVRDVIVEASWFKPDATTLRQLSIFGVEDITVRNNIFSMTGNAARSGVYIERRGVEPAPNRLQIYNNTLYSATTGAFNGITLSSAVTNATVRNNLGYAPGGTGSPTVLLDWAAGTTKSNNASSVLTNPNFSANPPTAPAHYAPTSGYPVDGGTSVPVWRDFFRTLRTGTYDIGAVNP